MNDSLEESENKQRYVKGAGTSGQEKWQIFNSNADKPNNWLHLSIIMQAIYKTSLYLAMSI